MSGKIIKLNRKKGGPAANSGTNAGDGSPGVEGIRALGFEHERYFYLSPLSQQLVVLTASEHSSPNLCRLQNLNWWKTNYHHKGPTKDFDVARARNDLMEACHAVGPFDPELVRGRGIWMEAGGPVAHEGDWIRQGGLAWQPASAPFASIYEAARAWSKLMGPALEEGEGRRVLDACGALAFTSPQLARFLAGWLVVAPVCACLEWRPHVWLTGPAGSGKSWVLNNVVIPVLGYDMPMYVQGETTEAGLRQELRSDSRPIVFDEAEGEKRAGLARIQKVLAFARYMSTSNGAKLLKGSSGHDAVSFAGAATVCMASIHVPLVQQADESRFTVLELRKRESTDPDAREPAALLDADFRRGLLAATVRHLDVLRANIRTFSDAIAQVWNTQRLGDQLGTLLAGARLLESYALVSHEDALDEVSALDRTLVEVAQGEPDHVRCLADICAWAPRADTESGKRQVTRTIGWLIAARLQMVPNDVLSGSEIDLVLGRHGIRVLRDLPGEEPSVAVANNHPQLRNILKETNFCDGWRHLLLRLPKATSSPHPIRVGPGEPKARCVVLPKELFGEVWAGTASVPSVPPYVPENDDGYQ